MAWALIRTRRGLGEGNGKETLNMMNLEKKVDWLKKFLPKVLPKAQIKTFNYASQFMHDAPRESLRDIATKLLSCIHDERINTDKDDGDKTSLRNPIIFIGHSFGGHVIQQALVLAAQQKKYQHILLHTSSVFFLGTAHRGTPVASIGVKMGYAAAALGTGADTALMEKLREHSEDMQNTINDFAIQAREANIDLLCFYELYTTRIVLRRTPCMLRSLTSIFPSISTLVVDRESATLPGWRPIGLTTDHSGLNKFQSKNDHNFKLVAAKLKERAKTAVSAIKKRIEDGNARKALQRLHFIVPHMRSSTFRPRISITKKIEAILKQAEQEPDHQQCRAALFGLAGSGKTARALNLAYSYQGRAHVLWVNASTVDTFNNTMTTIGREIHPTEDGLITSQADLMMATKDWLESPRSGKWLLIVDGANNSTSDYMGYIEQFIPHKRGTVIFTSTTKQIIGTVGSPDQAIEIGAMSFVDGEVLFKKVSGLKDVDRKEMEKLLEHLDYLPLAITQAASYIRTREIRIERYLEMIEDAEEHSQALMFDPSSADPHDYTAPVSRSVMTTFLLTLDQIKEANPKAVLLLQFMSLLGANIPLSVLKPLRLGPLDLRKDTDFHDAIGLLISYHMVVRSHSYHFSEDTYRVHRLVARRARISMNVEKPHMSSIVLEAMESQFPHPEPSKRNLKICAGFLQHAEAILAHAEDFEDLEDIRNQLKSKIELFKFYAYEYQKDELQAFTSKLGKDKHPVSARISEQAASKALNQMRMPEGLDYDLTAATLSGARVPSPGIQRTRSQKSDSELIFEHREER